MLHFLLIAQLVQKDRRFIYPILETNVIIHFIHPTSICTAQISFVYNLESFAKTAISLSFRFGELPNIFRDSGL